MSLGHYPLLGGLLSVMQIVIAYVIKTDPGAMLIVPPFIMQLIQIGAWFGAMAVALVTVLGWLKTNTTLLDKWKWLKEKK